VALFVSVGVSGRDLRVTRSRLAIAVGSVALAVLVGACSGEPKPKFAPAESSVPSVIESSSPAAQTTPALPTKARRNTPAGAEAFVRYFIEVLNYAQKTGDTARLHQASTSRCAACEGYVEAIESTYSTGGRVKGGALTVGRLRELPRDYGADWGAYGRGRATPQTILRSDGTKSSFDGGRFALYAYTRWVNDRWAMQWMRTPT
jgi:hypothetical protein